MKTALHFTADCEEVRFLRAADPLMGKLIDMVGDLYLGLHADYFTRLARSIIGQQLSVKAARTIWERVSALCSDRVNAAEIAALPVDELRQAGLSMQKTTYLKSLAEAVINNSLDLNSIDGLPDEQVIFELTKIKGVGTWTAEMFLIFALGRPDIFSLGDAGLQRSVKWLYGQGSYTNQAELEALAVRWRPYRTAASLYLWEAINKGIL